jgi:hypothetical protein
MTDKINYGGAQNLAYYPAAGTDIAATGNTLKWDPVTKLLVLEGTLEIDHTTIGEQNFGLSVVHYGTDLSPVFIGKSFGTKINPVKVSTNHILGSICFIGRADTDFRTGAFINAVSDGVINDSSMPTKLVFGTHNGSRVDHRAELTKLGEFRVNSIKNFSGGDLTLNPDGKVVVNIGKLNITGGSPGQVLTVSAGGVLAWSSPSTDVMVPESTIRNAISAGAGIAFNKVTGFITNTIRSTDSLTEGTSRLYYTDTRSRNALSFVSGPAGYDQTTGVISIPTSINSLSRITPPATATSSGTAGQIAYDSNYVYICTATNTWKRSALSSW